MNRDRFKVESPRRSNVSCGRQEMGSVVTIIYSHVLPIDLFHTLIPTGPFSLFLKVLCSHEVYCRGRGVWWDGRSRAIHVSTAFLTLTFHLGTSPRGTSLAPGDRRVGMWILVPLRGLESIEESIRGREARVDMWQTPFQTQTGRPRGTLVVRKITNLCVGPCTLGHGYM